MSKDRLDISDNTAISMPMRNLISIVAAVAVGVWAYFGVLERITMLETKSTLAEKDLNQAIETIGADLEKNTEFRIKWPRGEMGSLPADSEQFMLIEHIAGQVEAIQKQMENMMNNLEAGGQISEESQGQGAQRMYDTVTELETRVA